jgi:hypothetical protein
LSFVGEEFKEKIIPHAVDFFTGKALDYEDYDDEDDFEVNQWQLWFFFLCITNLNSMIG